MAESKKRKKNGHEVEDDTEIQNWTDGIPLSPAWWAPTFVALMILGLLWVVVYYISSGTYPVPKLGAWNIAVGLGTMMVGFLMMTQVTDIDFTDVEVAVPAFLTIILMPFAYSITVGMGAGFIMFVLIRVIRGRAKDVHWLMYLVAALFIAYFLRGGIESLLL